MSRLIERPPLSAVEPVTEVLHGVPITDRYRWLEDQNSPETRAWIDDQTRYARAYLDAIPGRAKIVERVRELLDIERCDSFIRGGNRWFFRKRFPRQEQPAIYFREGQNGEDQLLVDPTTRCTGEYTTVKPVRASCDGSLLLYEVKQGGERAGVFEILDVAGRRRLPDALPHGYLRGLAFAPDGRSFYYSHEATGAERPCRRAVLHHVLGSDFAADREIFSAGENERLRLVLVSSAQTLGFLVCRFREKTYTHFYLWQMESGAAAIPVLRDAEYSFAPWLLPGRLLAVIDQGAPNRRVVEVQARKDRNPLYFDLVPETEALIRNWVITANHVVVMYAAGTRSRLAVFDRFGSRTGEIPSNPGETVRIVCSSGEDDEILLERESFAQPIEVHRCNVATGVSAEWARQTFPPEPSRYRHTEICLPSKDGASIPMFLVGDSRALATGAHPAVMTSYGGYGASSTPQFSVFVAFLLEHGCLFALPGIRGGSEFGAAWHTAAMRRKRQVAIDDFLAAANSLIDSGRTPPQRLGIFGGSNSGLLVGAAMTQRPDLFRAVLCMVPMLDMLRYHLFDNAYAWTDEFGTAEDRDDFHALYRYSPYHAVKDGVAYPATMFVSGDADQNCNPMHARKMTARLQAATASGGPVLLDYSHCRGHSPVLPLTERINALTDRLAFFCDQLRVSL
jgi:prolyl oligopeptidase